MSKQGFIPGMDKPVCHLSTRQASPFPSSGGGQGHARAPLTLLRLAGLPGDTRALGVHSGPVGLTALQPLCPAGGWAPSWQRGVTLFALRV